MTKRELALRAVLQDAIRAWPQFDLSEGMPGVSEADVQINGADLVEWFAGWRQKAIAAVYSRSVT